MLLFSSVKPTQQFKFIAEPCPSWSW